MTTERRGIPPLLLEQLALRELSPEQERQLRESCGEQKLQSALLALREGNRQFEEQQLSQPLLASIEQRIESARQERAASGISSSNRSARLLPNSAPWLRSAVMGVAPALAAAALVWLVAAPFSPRGTKVEALSLSEPVETTRVKGNSQPTVENEPAKKKTSNAGQLLVYRRVGGEGTGKNGAPEPTVEQLHHGDEVRAGDILQLGYVSKHSYGLLLSLDGRGEVNLHWPTSSDRPPLLVSREALLDFSYQLDDSPQFERFFFVSSSETFSVKSVISLARKLGRDSDNASRDPLPVQKGLSVTSLTLQKASQ